MEKQLVTVSRKWHEPFIRTDITEIGIGVTMTLEDFVIALAAEMRVSPDALLSAADRVAKGMKQETAKSM